MRTKLTQQEGPKTMKYYNWRPTRKHGTTTRKYTHICTQEISILTSFGYRFLEIGYKKKSGVGCPRRPPFKSKRALHLKAPLRSRGALCSKVYSQKPKDTLPEGPLSKAEGPLSNAEGNFARRFALKRRRTLCSKAPSQKLKYFA